MWFTAGIYGQWEKFKYPNHSAIGLFLNTDLELIELFSSERFKNKQYNIYTVIVVN